VWLGAEGGYGGRSLVAGEEHWVVGIKCDIGQGWPEFVEGE